MFRERLTWICIGLIVLVVCFRLYPNNNLRRAQMIEGKIPGAEPVTVTVTGSYQSTTGKNRRLTHIIQWRDDQGNTGETSIPHAYLQGTRVTLVRLPASVEPNPAHRVVYNDPSSDAIAAELKVIMIVHLLAAAAGVYLAIRFCFAIFRGAKRTQR
jgi:hypothetical protein